MTMIVSQESDEKFHFDGIEEENITDPADVTEHPVETIKYVSDHRQPQPLTVSIEGIVTGSPLLNTRLGSGRPINEPVGDDRHQAAKDFFDRLADEELFTYGSISLGVFENLSVEEVSYSQDDSSNQLKVSLELVEIKFGRIEVVDLPPIIPPGQEPEQDLGFQPGEEIDCDQLEAQTIAERTLGGASLAENEGFLPRDGQAPEDVDYMDCDEVADLINGIGARPLFDDPQVWAQGQPRVASAANPNPTFMDQ